MPKVRITKAPRATGSQSDYGLVRKSSVPHTGDSEREVKNTMTELKGKDKAKANIEVEGGETVLGDVNRDGYAELFEFKGKRHSEGGMAVDIPEGSFIFSDTSKLKIKDKEMLKQFFGLSSKRGGYTPAEISKRFQINEFIDVLKNKESDEMAKRSAHEMIKNNMQKLGLLAFVQESIKGFPEGVPDVAQIALQELGIDPNQLIQEVAPQQQGQMPPQEQMMNQQQMPMAMNGKQVKRKYPDGGDLPSASQSKQNFDKYYPALLNKLNTIYGGDFLKSKPTGVNDGTYNLLKGLLTWSDDRIIPGSDNPKHPMNMMLQDLTSGALSDSDIQTILQYDISQKLGLMDKASLWANLPSDTIDKFQKNKAFVKSMRDKGYTFEDGGTNPLMRFLPQAQESMIDLPPVSYEGGVDNSRIQPVDTFMQQKLTPNGSSVPSDSFGNGIYEQNQGSRGTFDSRPGSTFGPDSNPQMGYPYKYAQEGFTVPVSDNTVVSQEYLGYPGIPRPAYTPTKSDETSWLQGVINTAGFGDYINVDQPDPVGRTVDWWSKYFETPVNQTPNQGRNRMYGGSLPKAQGGLSVDIPDEPVRFIDDSMGPQENTGPIYGPNNKPLFDPNAGRIFPTPNTLDPNHPFNRNEGPNKRDAITINDSRFDFLFDEEENKRRREERGDDGKHCVDCVIMDNPPINMQTWDETTFDNNAESDIIRRRVYQPGEKTFWEKVLHPRRKTSRVNDDRWNIVEERISDLRSKGVSEERIEQMRREFEESMRNYDYNQDRERVLDPESGKYLRRGGMIHPLSKFVGGGQFGGQFGDFGQTMQRAGRFADLYGQAQDEMMDMTSWDYRQIDPENPAAVRRYMMENPRLGWEVAGAPTEIDGRQGFLETVVQPVPQGYADWADYAKQNEAALQAGVEADPAYMRQFGGQLPEYQVGGRTKAKKGDTYYINNEPYTIKGTYSSWSDEWVEFDRSLPGFVRGKYWAPGAAYHDGEAVDTPGNDMDELRYMHRDEFENMLKAANEGRNTFQMGYDVGNFGYGNRFTPVEELSGWDKSGFVDLYGVGWINYPRDSQLWTLTSEPIENAKFDIHGMREDEEIIEITDPSGESTVTSASGETIPETIRASKAVLTPGYLVEYNNVTYEVDGLGYRGLEGDSESKSVRLIQVEDPNTTPSSWFDHTKHDDKKYRSVDLKEYLEDYVQDPVYLGSIGQDASGSGSEAIVLNDIAYTWDPGQQKWFYTDDESGNTKQESDPKTIDKLNKLLKARKGVTTKDETDNAKPASQLTPGNTNKSKTPPRKTKVNPTSIKLP